MARVVLLAGLYPGNGRLPRVAPAGRPWVDVDVQLLDVDDVLDGRRAWAANPDPHPPSPQPLLRGVEWRGQFRPQWPIPLDARLRADAVRGGCKGDGVAHRRAAHYTHFFYHVCFVYNQYTQIGV